MERHRYPSISSPPYNHSSLPRLLCSWWRSHPPPPPLTTMLSLSTSGSSSGHDQEPPHTGTGATSPHVVKVKQTSPPQYTEKFKRLMKNRESAARSRARKQARAD
ncbi:hypothetical protein L1987_65295 [Smallanthus sonchifolius]|uniref:Uncharacterized protein n=1 Tax=Smallanthus sonchifolius TaxID=185202 RepID=A0ACB9BU46_9ASTR|nr:hypothetical protein L1987_65295 [Smallanthus sonchifolius]